MFLMTYKSTLKTLLRSALLWGAILLVVVIAFVLATGVNVRVTLVDDNYRPIGFIDDTDERFVLEFDVFIQRILNLKAWVMNYSMQILCVVSAMLVLNRDFGDNFFEIEKASGVKTGDSFVGRLAALVTVNAIVCLLISLISIHYYYFSRGGMSACSISEYFAMSTVRVFRLFITSMLPTILFYITLTYAAGSCLKSGFAGVTIGSGYLIFDLLLRGSLMYRTDSFYLDYVTPVPNKLYQYWAFYDTEWFVEKTFRNPFTESQMLLSITITMSISLLCCIVAFTFYKKRET